MSEARVWRGFFRFRALIIVLACVLGFLLGALYLSVEQMDVGGVFVVTGSPRFAPGQPTALRVSAYYDIQSPRRRAARVFVTPEARFHSAAGPAGAGPTLPLSISGHTPAIVRFTLPGDGGPGGTLVLTVRTEDSAAAREVHIPIPPSCEEEIELSCDERKPETEGELDIALLPEDRVLIHGLPNRLFVRVAEEDGVGTPSRVTLQRRGQPDRSFVAGPSGIAAFDIEGGAFRYALTARAEDARGREGRTEKDFDPVPRGRRIRLLPRVAHPGRAVRVEVTSVTQDELLHCDMLTGERILDSFSISVARAQGSHTSLAPATEGVYRIQCAPYYTTHGQQSYASRALVVSRAVDSLAPLAMALLSPNPEEQEFVRWLAGRAETFSTPERAIASDYLAARLVPPYVPSTSLHNTLAEDQGGLRARRDALRGRLLLALGVALFVLLLWAALLIGSNVVEARRNARLFSISAEEEDDDAPVPSPADLGATRAGLHYVIFIALLMLNVLAVLWLLGTVVR